jgi:pSer/pThr/pTyr-binding forkhead associated (FHA) protein
MTFKLNQVSTSAEGREIRRAKEVPGERLTIGRLPTSDVHLTDLAVALNHATVQRVGHRLTVAAEEGLGVEINGRKVTSGFMELAQGGELRIASHLLRFLPAAMDAQEIQVDVERVGESSADEADRADIRRFSVGAVLPGKRGSAYVLMLLVLGVFLAWPIYVYSQRQPANAAQITQDQRKEDGSGLAEPKQASFSPDSMWSTGSLSQVHHGLEGQCSACHVKAFEPVQDAACIACHKVADHGVPQKTREEKIKRFLASKPQATGWEQFQLTVAQNFGHNPGRCVDCHLEHEGPHEMPRTAQTDCSGCHTDLKTRLPDAEVGNASDFGRAHPEFRPAVLLDWSGETPNLVRVPLDRNPSEQSNLKFPHDIHLNLTDRSKSTAASQMVSRLKGVYGGRQQLTCSDCHTATPDGARYQPVDMEEDCAACHTLAFDQADGVNRELRHGSPQQVIADLREFYRNRVPGRPAELSPIARQRPGQINQVRTAVQYARARAGAGSAANRAITAVFREGGACYDCHTIEQRGPLDFHVRPVAFPSRYLLHGWFDHRAHVNMNLQGESFGGDQACLTCHAATQSTQSANLLVPRLESCQRCHVGENSNQQVIGQRVSSGCAMCHDYHINEGVPAMILRQRVRGQRWESTVTPVTASVRSR